MEKAKSKQPPTVLSQIYNSPVYILWIICLLVFICATVVMIIISFLRPASLGFEPLLNSFLLLIFLFPALYFFVYRPFMLNMAWRKKMEEQCQRSRDQLEAIAQERAHELLRANTYPQPAQLEKMEEIGELVNNVAHEVKNPLAIILQGVEYLKEKLKSNDESIVLILRFMGDAIIRADKVIVGLMDFANLSRFDMQANNLNAVMEKALLKIKVDLDRHQIQVVKNLREDLPLARIDKKRIEQVFVNVLMNAVQAMPEGGVLFVKTYPLEVQGGRKAAFVQIEDTGPGISKEISQRIFSPFLTTKREKGSRGLGLAVSRYIIQMHGGTIDIKNRKESPGASVRVVLPA
jgi:signal transduction histidine kinase